MLDRRKFLRMAALAVPALGVVKKIKSQGLKNTLVEEIVISTWSFGMAANEAAWEILGQNGKALDAVENGVMVTESSQNLSVGLGALPDRTGKVTLDACIMDEKGNCGSVAFLEQIKHPVSVARMVMEKTKHIMLVGSGAQKFALENGFKLESKKLSPEAAKHYKAWQKVQKANNENHDTIGMLAKDSNGNLSGCCTTSGLAYKIRGRVGDSPIIGAGLFVDNEIGAATATGVGEEVIRVCGSHLVVELMRQGKTPVQACREGIERIVKHNPEKAKGMQVAFLALNKRGEYGAFALQKGFEFALKTKAETKLVASEYYFD